ncbi:MFS transporter [Corynebacterium glyciniphilum]|uniref:MFS transporter n=1 Tax=Corynebacterium glyciniphilum TaxID=1404244 RepID=UPI0011AB7BA5|nr:MFS transporter [Corynebacterium glyciniphilum]
MAAQSETSPSKLTELRHGWRVLLASTLGIAGGIIAIPYYTNALFFPELSAEFGWSSANLSLVVLVYNLTWALLMPFVGRLTDRFGVRVPALVSGFFLAVGYLLLSTVGNNFALYFVVFVITMGLSICTGAIGFARAIGVTFDRMRGLALGIILAGSGVTAVIAPQVLGPIIENSGWRVGFRSLALAVIVLAVVVFLLMPSGVNRDEGKAERKNTAEDVRKVPFKRIIAEPVFRRLALAFLCMALAVGGMVIHLYPMMLEAGVSEGAALWVQSAMGFTVVIGRLLSGYLFDKFHAPHVVASILALAAVGLTLLVFGGPHLALAAAFAVGFCVGAEVDVVALLTSRFFAMDVFGQLYGLLYAAFTLGLAGSPYVIGLLVDNTDGFVPTVSYSAVLLLLGSILFVTLPRYGEPRLRAVETVTTQDPAETSASADDLATK